MLKISENTTITIIIALDRSMVWSSTKIVCKDEEALEHQYKAKKEETKLTWASNSGLIKFMDRFRMSSSTCRLVTSTDQYSLQVKRRSLCVKNTDKHMIVIKCMNSKWWMDNDEMQYTRKFNKTIRNESIRTKDCLLNAKCRWSFFVTRTYLTHYCKILQTLQNIVASNFYSNNKAG